MKLSLCIAVFNEEKFIHYPLNSAYDLVDEVIIVDGGSEDKTVAIATSYGKKVKVIHTTNPPMFHINKQKALDAARGDWILQLDADEELSEELKEEINGIVRGPALDVPPASASQSLRAVRIPSSSVTPHDIPVAYNLPRKNFFLSRFLEKGGQYPDYTIRLYRRGSAHFPCKSVHENVEVDGEVGYLKSPLLHYADPDFSRYLLRWNRYTSLDADLAVKNNEKLGFFTYFILKPKLWFLKTYLRHRGYKDGFPGFVFALFSSIRFWAIYIKAWQIRHEKQKLRPL